MFSFFSFLVKSFRYFIPNRSKRLLFCCLFVCFHLVQLPLSAQNKRDLEKKKAALSKDIDYTNKLLNQTRKNKNSSISNLVTLNKKIDRRTELINTVQSEVSLVNQELNTVSLNIDSLQQRLTGLKKQYAEMVYYAYKNQGSYFRMMFIFSAEDFNQAWKRMKYLRLLSDYRLQQRDLIYAVQDSLNGKREKLHSARQEKSQLLSIQEKQKKELDKEKQEQVRLLNNLMSREKKLRAELKEKQRQEQLLANKIEEIIRKEIEAARSAARKKAAAGAKADVSPRKVESTGTSVLANTPESIKLSNDFESNKGQLPWPVEQGIISSSFGKHAHPLWRDVVINNNGIDIKSGKGSKARSIFEGRVIRVIMVVDKYAVLIQHGEYFTLYSNLQEVYVKAGDKVITKQPLGLIQTNEEDEKTEVHLEIWKGSNKMDPEIWLASRR